MNDSTAKSLAVITTGTVFTVGVLKSLLIKERLPPFKFFVASGLTGVGLLVSSDLAPRITGPIALLILTVVALEDGADVLTAINDRTDQSEKITDETTHAGPTRRVRRTRRTARPAARRKNK